MRYIEHLKQVTGVVSQLKENSIAKSISDFPTYRSQTTLLNETQLIKTHLIR